MEEFTESDREALERLKQRLEKDPSFSDHDVKVIKDMIQTYIGLQAWGRMTRIIVVGLAMIAAAVTAWEVLSQKVRAWFGG